VGHLSEQRDRTLFSPLWAHLDPFMELLLSDRAFDLVVPLDRLEFFCTRWRLLFGGGAVSNPSWWSV